MLVYGAGAAFFCLEPEPTQFGRSRSRLRDLELPEPEPPKKVADPQHCSLQKYWCETISLRGRPVSIGARLSLEEGGLPDQYRINTELHWCVLISGIFWLKTKQ